jgi:hypothetical protein
MSDDVIPFETPRTQPGKNGGRLRRGGTNAGAGRPKDIVRSACALAFDQRLPLLKKIADAKIEGATIAERLKALDMLAKYGGLLITESEVTHKRGITPEDVDEVRKELGLDAA